MKGKWILDFPIEDIIFDENNPNVTSDRDERASKAFLTKWGVIRAVAINLKNICVDGEHITKRAIAVGVKTVTVFQGDFKTEAEIAEVRAFLNYGPKGIPDEVKFANELDKIARAGNMARFSESMGKSADEFNRALEAMRNPKDSMIPNNVKAIVKPGEIWKCGPHFVMCGDAIKTDDIATLIAFGDDKKFPRMLFTDPPYDFDDFEWLTPFLEITHDIEIFVMNGDWGTVKILSNYVEYFKGFFPIRLNSSGVVAYGNQPRPEHRIITHYRRGRSNFQNLHDAFGTWHEVVLRKDGLSRHEKPLELPKKFIVHYTKPEEIVFDLFAGSGTTMIACEQVGRVCYSMEKDPLNVDIILKRYEEFNHDKPVKV